MINFDSVRISVASPEQIISWSHGEVTKPETINYRTQKPERDGLFSESIFGPTKDYECYCGKYRKIRYKGVICDKCGVEVTKSSVRRERMGHIILAVPVAHIWYVRGVPSILSLVLDLSVKELEKVIYFGSYVVLDVNEEIRKNAVVQLEKEYQKEKTYLTKKVEEATDLDVDYQRTLSEIKNLKPLSIISDVVYHDLSMRYGQIAKVSIGAAAIRELLTKINIDEEIKKIKIASLKATPLQKKKMMRRLKLFSDLKNAKIRPEWTIITVLPVIPPDLRPMVQLDGGRFAASDLNDLYRRVINRNNRLKRLISQGAPEVITRNEKRMLQEAVDALVDNQAARGKGVATSSGRRKLRSLSDMLRGKQGRFRQNLLGKRVDYSGRSVIVVGPELSLNQCGLPKIMAMELFKPFVISKLIKDGYAHNVKNAQRLIEKGESFVWDILEEITKEHYVLLNRAPTLHRLGIQAFLPVLIEGKAISIHPLVCTAYNADFDGDQMAVHVPLSEQAKYEAKEIMRSVSNLLKPASGEPVVTPSNDMILGCHYLTTAEKGEKGEGKYFASEEEAIMACNLGAVSLRALVKVEMDNNIIETTVGRIIFNQMLPDDFSFMNQAFNKKDIARIIGRSFALHGQEKTAELVDKIKDLGFYYASTSGITFSINDIKIPAKKEEIIKAAESKLNEIYKQYQRGLITDFERYEKSVEVWMDAKTKVEKEMLTGFHQFNPIYSMVSSGSRGSVTQLTQIAGMKGLVVNPAGEIIELPVKSNFKEGFSVFEYFISTHGARKGRSDTALRTSDAGYLTRRLVDVAQDIVVGIDDCHAEGISVTKEESDDMGVDFKDRIRGRFLAEDIKKMSLKRNQLINQEIAEKIIQSEVSEVCVRSPLKCLSKVGICQKCYGEDLAKGGLVKQGEAVGIIAAQAIGEPGTQLTMRTFHIGGIVGEDITQGLPRVEELFEARAPRFPAVVSEIDGKIKIKEEKDKKTIEVMSTVYPSETIELKGFKVLVKNNDKVVVKQAVASAPNEKAKRASVSGIAEVHKDKIIIKSKVPMTKIYHIPNWIVLMVEEGDLVKIGQPLVEGHLDLHQMLHLVGCDKTAKYIVKEVQSIYASQGQTINEKHIEIITKQMFSMVRIISSGGSIYLPGQLVSRLKVIKENEKLGKNNKKPIGSEEVILGITKVSLKTDSFLSAASFQETTSVLINAATQGTVDHLKGLKENVIIGKLIPAGTGYKG
ncbi:MAG: DNA-directed RNA polymerase subunit beta' [Candidatus Berkelbacteria bacterium]|nr:DNA-directed RNA polymerase subunit beta' [Candidatus Berkelbacteria bacterium]